MARRPRVDFPGAWHHVMNRGVDHQAIFRTDEDRRSFLLYVAQASLKFGVEIHAYCLLDNHYHLLVRSRDGDLSGAMKHVGQKYTQHFNRRHGRDGALFRGRFHSVLVESGEHLDELVRYIHLNPTAGRPEIASVAHQWSSLSGYLGYTASESWLFEDEILRRFGSRTELASFILGDLAIPEPSLHPARRPPHRASDDDIEVAVRADSTAVDFETRLVLAALRYSFTSRTWNEVAKHEGFASGNQLRGRLRQARKNHRCHVARTIRALLIELQRPT